MEPFELPDSSLLLKEATRIFSDLFKGFKANRILVRDVSESNREVRIPFVYETFEIPRHGILVYDVQVIPFVKVSFNPFASQPRPEENNGIDWIKMLFVDSHHEFYALEPLLISAFCIMAPKSICVAEDPNGS